MVCLIVGLSACSFVRVLVGLCVSSCLVGDLLVCLLVCLVVCVLRSLVCDCLVVYLVGGWLVGVFGRSCVFVCLFGALIGWLVG